MKDKNSKVLRLKVDPSMGVAQLAASILPPKGYYFHSMTRKNRDVTITYRKIKGEKDG